MTDHEYATTILPRTSSWAEPTANFRWRAGVLEQSWRRHWDNGDWTYEWCPVPTVPDDHREETP